jgi:hypothetical protein
VGILEAVLTARYGPAEFAASAPFSERRWNYGNEAWRCVLYERVIEDESLRERYLALADFYGDCLGGYLLLNSINIAMLAGPTVWGLYSMDTLQSHPAVLRANVHDARILYFMDSANVWYYGVKDKHLFVYDAETDEISDLGELERAIAEVLSEWEEVVGRNAG